MEQKLVTTRNANKLSCLLFLSLLLYFEGILYNVYLFYFVIQILSRLSQKINIFRKEM